MTQFLKKVFMHATVYNYVSKKVQNYFPFVTGSDRTRTLLWEMSELCNGQCSN